MSTETDVALADALDRLNARLDRLEHKVDALSAFATLAGRLPAVADAAGSTAGWVWSQAEQAGIDPIQTGRQAAEIGLRLADPKAIGLIERLLERQDALASAVEALESIDPDDLNTVATKGASLTANLAALMRAPEFERLLQAGTDPKTLSTAESATTALVEVRSQPIESVGAFGAFFKLGDPDVKRAVGFSLSLAKRFGQLIQG